MEFSQVIPTTYGKIRYGTVGKQTLGDLKEKYPFYPKTHERWMDYTKDWAIRKFENFSDRIVTLNQVHGDKIHSIHYPDPVTPGREQLFEGDGLYTELQNTLLVVRTADCVPVFLYSNKRPFVAVLHSGWKGTNLGITELLLGELLHFGYELDEIEIEIGPYIQGQDYEVGEDVAAHFLSLGEAVCFPKENGKFLLDVGLAIEVRVRKQFGTSFQIKNSHTNVFQNPLYFSHRAKEEGRNLNFILWES
ncbi:YfiH family protein [Leptospira wolbachii serovar Codice str. CDC]|uniref:YfiH family protein n=1 Tax=Leptospira wolbachii serovar Codice str. CDC TaxID=1218599 RepID=R9A682_9LEPT|nr:polyphenol oxidase family protein [Leptospira wolbachii]EOQ97534.1 YfiH family protein [Leptospira wolbachii serovar Codice str. CDC]